MVDIAVDVAMDVTMDVDIIHNSELLMSLDQLEMWFWDGYNSTVQPYWHVYYERSCLVFKSNTASSSFVS